MFEQCPNYTTIPCGIYALQHGNKCDRSVCKWNGDGWPCNLWFCQKVFFLFTKSTITCKQSISTHNHLKNMSPRLVTNFVWDTRIHSNEMFYIMQPFSLISYWSDYLPSDEKVVFFSCKTSQDSSLRNCLLYIICGLQVLTETPMVFFPFATLLKAVMY